MTTRRRPASGATAARGYGWRHQQQRAKVKRLVDAGQAVCWRCGGWIPPGSKWDLGHLDGHRDVYAGPEHRSCNRATSTHREQRRGRGATGAAPAAALQFFDTVRQHEPNTDDTIDTIGA
jgi:hypothetical protein